MKELRIPVQSSDFVDLSSIDRDFKGLVIGYKDDKAIGHIQYSDGSWYLLTDIDWESNSEDDESLLNLITYLIESKRCNHFKVIEFVQ